MEDSKKVRKRLVKIVAIVFVVVLLLLTFFSNTIMNYSLPEVATVYIEGGSVSNKVRCQGTAETGDMVEVKVSGERVIEKVKVKNGDTVKKGDVLFEFEEEANKELREARKELETLRIEYDKKMTETIDNSDLVEAIENAQKDLNKANKELAEAQENAAKYTNAKNELAALEQQQATLEQQLATLEQQLTDMGETPEGEEESPEKQALKQQIETVKQQIEDIKQKVEEKKTEVSGLEESSKVEDAAENVHDKEKALRDAREAYSKKQQEDVFTKRTDALETEELVANIAEAEKKVEKLEKQDDSTSVKATVDGTVDGISIKAGDTVKEEDILASITPQSDIYKVNCMISKEEAKLIKIGDEAEIENIWEEGVSATVSNIKGDPSNPNQGRIVTFDVTGEYIQAGDTIMLSVGEKSLKSDTVVPNNAVKEDSDGKFVLVVRVKGTPLGNRYTVQKKKVEIVARDSAHSAITGEIESYDNVVTNSSKPLENGQQVRLKEDY